MGNFQWIFLLVCFYGALYTFDCVDAQLLKLPKFRWPSFNRGPKKDNNHLSGELKGASTNQDGNHMFNGPPPPGGLPHGPNGPMRPPPPPPPPGVMVPPPPIFPSMMSFGGPFSFAKPPNVYDRTPAGSYAFPNVVNGPQSESPGTYYTSSPGRKTRRRRPIYDNDSLEDASTEDEPVYIKVKSRKRRPIVIDEDELLGRAHDGASSEEVDDNTPKISYKSRSKPQVVYLDSSREYPSTNERRTMLLKNEDYVQDAPSYQSPTISALHASIGSGGYQLNSKRPSREQTPDVFFVNNLQRSTGPTYRLGNGNRNFREHATFPDHIYLQSSTQQRSEIQRQQPSQKTYHLTETSTPPTIRIVLNSLNQQPSQAYTTPNPVHLNKPQIPPPQEQASLQHFHVIEPNQNEFSDKPFQFSLRQQDIQPDSWQSPPVSQFQQMAPTVPSAPKHEKVKVARRSFPGNSDFQPVQDEFSVRVPQTEVSVAAPTKVFIEKPRKRATVQTEAPTVIVQPIKSQQRIDYSCTGKRSGYYANKQYKCQIYHQCSKRKLVQTFMCPNGTAFNEKQKLCERFDKVACVQDEVKLPKKQQTSTDQPPKMSSRSDETHNTQFFSTNDPTTLSSTSSQPSIAQTDESNTAPSKQSSHEAKFSTSVSYSHSV